MGYRDGVGWQTIDLRSDPDVAEHGCDPAEVISALDDLLGARPEWHADAACKEHPELTWYPEKGDATEAQRAICQSCLVRRDCLIDALERRDLQGLWGGHTGTERNAARRKAPGDVVAQADALLAVPSAA